MQTLQEFLASYDVTKYRTPSVTVDIAVFSYVSHCLNVLLIRRKDHPYIGAWALPGGFIEMRETLLEAAQRELMEETSQRAQLYPIGMFGEPTRDPRTRVITAAFTACVPKSALSLRAGDDAADAQMFRISLEWGGEIDLPERQPCELIHLPCTASGEAPRRGRACTLAMDGPVHLDSHLALCADGPAQTPVLIRSDMACDHALIVLHALLFLEGRGAVRGFIDAR